MVNKIQITNCQYLSQFIDKLPSHCLINKGITGCGGTTLELQSKRNSIILCPTKNLVASKVKPEFLGVTGETTNKEIKDYAMGEGDKKIIATFKIFLSFNHEIAEPRFGLLLPELSPRNFS